MKIKKTLSAILAATAAVAAGCTFMACGGGKTTVNGPADGPDDKKPTGGIKTYTIEAEYIDIENVIGSGLSSDQSGYQMIYGDGTEAQKKLGWSGGYYVGYTYSPECVMEFVFNSDKETTGTIVIRLGSEIGDSMFLTPDKLDLSLNGTSINYGSFSLTSVNDLSKMTFKDCTVINNAKILKGENKFVFSVKQNDIRGTQTGGPTVDCVKITTDAVITYDAKTDNPTHRDEI